MPSQPAIRKVLVVNHEDEDLLVEVFNRGGGSPLREIRISPRSHMTVLLYPGQFAVIANH